ncbi:hypothetical protein Vretimale_10440 [Volvox reticuliferus]|uniref:Uncharacterized protein n=1 Tax=Volvox reticuliferus TaxID=1737510 RepID=A0A8J4CID4_9CHLO|nr:hypothetical protein Vretifemale_12396 [Volvox reticuliferus]GIM06026.1 hypothetical protein Vretimale_10440 [Volvox reticuliferus]
MMRSKKVPSKAAGVADLLDNDAQEQKGISHIRKTSRSTLQCLSSVSSSTASSDAEAGPCLPGRGAKPSRPHSRHAVVIDHQGAGKVVHKPDGTVVWEPAPECADGGAARNGNRSNYTWDDVIMVLGAMFSALSFGSGLVGLTEAMSAAEAAARAGQPCQLTTRAVAEVVARYVTGSVAGLATGMVLGPVVAVRTVAGALARPALVGFLLHQGITRIARWRSGVAGWLRKLQSGDTSKVLEALRAIIAAAQRNPRFAREFDKLKGIEVLLQRLAAALPDCPILHLIAQALAELCRDPECRASLVAAGGVPRLVALLQNPNPVVSGFGLSALAQLADNALAVEAIRESGGLNRLVELTAAAVPSMPTNPTAATTTTAAINPVMVLAKDQSVVLSAVQQPGNAAVVTARPSRIPVPVLTTAGGAYNRRAVLLPAVKLLQALSFDPASKAAIGAAGGIPALLDVVARSESRSETQSEAIAALHSCLRGCADNQRILAALPQASEVLRAALAGFGPCWHTAKGDLHTMLNVLARLQGVQEASGFVVVQSQVAAAAARDAAAVGSIGPAAAGAVAAVGGNK